MMQTDQRRRGRKILWNVQQPGGFYWRSIMSCLIIDPIGRYAVFNEINNQTLTRQIRRTFAALGYNIEYLNRTAFGQHKLSELKSGEIRIVSP